MFSWSDILAVFCRSFAFNETSNIRENLNLESETTPMLKINIFGGK